VLVSSLQRAVEVKELDQVPRQRQRTEADKHFALAPALRLVSFLDLRERRRGKR
jgi:hypothetical protein